VASGNISKNMQVVREISSQTAEGSAATSTSVAKLAALSAQLRQSVAGFRLPDFDARSGAGTDARSGAGPGAAANDAGSGADTGTNPMAELDPVVSNSARQRTPSGVGA
jgi:twitching motility protein PilJ